MVFSFPYEMVIILVIKMLCFASSSLLHLDSCLFKLQIDAHRAPLAVVVLSSNGMYIATASEQGTIIRVFLVSEATKVKSEKPCFYWNFWPVYLLVREYLTMLHVIALIEKLLG